MILVDTGAFVALFDPKDPAHATCRRVLESLHEPIVTTVPVLTEAFHLLDQRSRGAVALREFVARAGAGVWFLGEVSLRRAFELMETYADRPMDLADASLVAAAEGLRATTVFTVDRRDFFAYRARIGRSLRAFTVIPEPA